MNNLSAPRTATTAPTKVAGEILLPDDEHMLYHWKVRNGSAVQKGETLALAILKPKDDEDGESTTTTAAAAAAAAPEVKKPASSSSSHRRPTKRRRPAGPVVASLAPAKSGGAAATIKAATVGAAGGTSGDLNNKTGDTKSHQPARRGATTDPEAAAAAAAASTSTGDSKMKKLLQKITKSDHVPIRATASGLVRMGSTNLAGKNAVINNPLMIGYIEECSHPTVVESLCAVCGTAVGPNKGSNNQVVAGVGFNNSGGNASSLNNGDKMSLFTVSGGITVSVSASEGQRMALQDAERLRGQRKLALVLDLDHTLLHATNDARARNELGRDDVRTLVLPMMEVVPNQQHQQQIRWQQLCVKLRPGIKEFLESAMPKYEIVVYTAGTRPYAEQITMLLARHLVGAKCDQPDFDRLRHEIARIQHELDSSEVLLAAKPTSSNENNDDDDDDDRKPAAKPVGGPDVSSPAPLPKDNDDSTDSKKSGEDETLPDAKRLKPADTSTTSETAEKRIGTATAAPANGDSSTAPVQVVEDPKPSADEGSSKPSATKVEEATADKFMKAAENETQSGNKTPLVDENSGLKSVLKENEDGDKKKKASPSKKRKRVRFGETPPTVKSDKATSEVLDKLRAELKEAERMEGLAHDLKQRLFGSRIFSRTDIEDLGTDTKSLWRIYPCGGTMAVVVDDREDVWARGEDNSPDVRKGEPPHNLLVVRPYNWNHFLGYSDVNNAPGEDWGDDDSDKNKSREYDNDIDEKQLMWTGDALRRIHERYYGNGTTTMPAQSRLTVPELIRNMRREVLMGTKIVLTGLVRKDQQRKRNRNGARPTFVRYAENLGAIVLPDVGPGLTHVVANDGTEKVVNARRTFPGCWIVKASWLMQAVWSLTRPAPLPHVLGPPPKVILSTSDDSSDDDEDLAAEFENELMGE